MTKIYSSLLGLLLLASCGPPRLITQGIPENSPDYLVKTDGKQINAAHVKSLGETSVTISPNASRRDTASYPFTALSAIKMGDAYLGIQDGLVYDGVYYGKVMLLKRLWGVSYDMNSHSSHAVYHYYLQKQGQADIVDLNNSNLIDYVQDDPLALRKARAARIYTDVTFTSAITTIAGLSCVFLPYTNHLRKPAVTIGLFSMPVFLITLPIGPHKRFKTVLLYNQ